GTGHTILNGASSLSGGFFSQLSRTVDNHGTATITNGNSIDFNGNAVWNNDADGTLVLQGTGGLGSFFPGPSAAVNNAGVVQKTGAAGSSTIGVAFNNTGTVHLLANTGTLTLSSGTSSGAFNLEAGSVLTVNDTFSSPYTLADGATSTGDGVLQ